MSRFDIKFTSNNNLVAKNVNSGTERKFTIKSTQCEINGDRDYLVDDETMLRVRLKERDMKTTEEAVEHWIEGYLAMRLYKHPEC